MKIYQSERLDLSREGKKSKKRWISKSNCIDNIQQQLSLSIITIHNNPFHTIVNQNHDFILTHSIPSRAKANSTYSQAEKARFRHAIDWSRVLEGFEKGFERKES